MTNARSDEQCPETAAQVTTLFAAVDERRWDDLHCVFHRDIVYERPGYEPFVGIDAVLRFYSDERVIATGRHIVEHVLTGETTVACFGRLIGTSRTGQPLDEPFADLYEFEGCLIRRRRSFFYRPAI
jgi:uncharacterized protein